MLGPALFQLHANLQRVASRSPYEEALFRELSVLSELHSKFLSNSLPPDPKRWGVWLDVETSDTDLAALGVDSVVGLMLQGDQPLGGGASAPSQWRMGAWRAEDSPAIAAMDVLGLRYEKNNVVRTEGYAIQMSPPWLQKAEDVLFEESAAIRREFYCGEPNCPHR